MKKAENAAISVIHNSIIKEVRRNALFSGELGRLNMNVYEMSYALLDSTWRRSGLFVPYSRIYYVCSGSADIYCNGHCTTLEAGNAYILPADSHYAFCCADKLEKFYFHFNLFRQDSFDVFSETDDLIVLKNRQKDIAFLRENWESNSLLSVLQTKALLYQAVCDGLSAAPRLTDALCTYSPVVQKTLDYIHEHLKVSLKLSELSEHLFFSESYIGKCFKAEIGHSVKEYLRIKILSEAAIALRHSRMPIKEISNAFGFCDPFYFSRQFSARYGMSPRAYRSLLFI